MRSFAATDHTVITPEAVSLTPDVAGLGSRMIAVAIDTLIQLGAVTLLYIAFFAATSRSTSLVIAYVLLVFVLVWGYFPIFEAVWGGRTPGKRAQRLQVVTTDGQPATFGPILIRNLLRLVDFLPAYYTIGALTILLTKRSQRLGDLAAGTMVIRERVAPAPTPLAIAPAEPAAASLDPTGITERQYELVRAFLERRTTFTPEARAALAARLASNLRPLAGWHGSENDEGFLEILFRSYRDRHTPAHGDIPPIPPPPAGE